MSEEIEILNSTDFLQDTDKLITQLDAERVEKQKQTFVNVKNSSPLNAINQITSIASGRQSGTLMELTNNTNGNVKVKLYYPISIRDDNNKKLQLTYTPTTAKLFMLYRWQFTDKGNKEVQISLSDYCKWTGSVRHRAKEKLKQDTAILMNLKLTMEYVGKGKQTSQYNANLFESCILTDDRIVLKCTDILSDLFNNSSIMAYPLPLLKIPCNSKQNPYAFVLGTKLYELYKMNMYDKKSKDKKDFFYVSIRTLLDVCYLNGMKTPEQVQEDAKRTGGKARYSQFIVKPFTDTISLLEGDYPDKPKKRKKNAESTETSEDKRPPLTQLVNITYCNSNKEPLDTEYNGNFTEWLTGYLRVQFVPEYERPDYDTKKARLVTDKKDKKTGKSKGKKSEKG